MTNNIHELLKTKDLKEIRKFASKMTKADLVALVSSLSKSDRYHFFISLTLKPQSDIFPLLSKELKAQLVTQLTDKELQDLLKHLWSDEIADLIRHLPKASSKRVVQHTPREAESDIKEILKYEEDQVGSVMTVDIIRLDNSWTVAKAIKNIREQRENNYISHYFFVVDKEGKLVGSVTAEELMFASDRQRVRDLAKPSGYVRTVTHLEEAAIEFAEHNMSSLPVVDEFDVVVGVITSDDMIDVVSDSANEDFKKMAGIGKDADVPYSRTSIFRMFRSRVVWLMLLMISSTISQIVLDAAQGWSDKYIVSASITTAIIAILPVISGAAGNAGSQSSTMVIRALATGDITTRDYRKVVWKEIKVAAAVGLALSVANFARLMIYYGARGDLNHEAINFITLSGAASIALFAVIVLAKTTGGLLPLLAKKMKMDPAVMAAPLLTTLIDALSTLIFFGISIGIMVSVL